MIQVFHTQPYVMKWHMQTGADSAAVRLGSTLFAIPTNILCKKMFKILEHLS